VRELDLVTFEPEDDGQALGGIESVAASGPAPGDAAEARTPASLEAVMGARAAIRSKIGAVIQGLLRGDTA